MTSEELIQKLDALSQDNTIAGRVVCDGRAVYFDQQLYIERVSRDRSPAIIDYNGHDKINLYTDVILNEPIQQIEFSGNKYCAYCGLRIADTTVLCYGCGSVQSHNSLLMTPSNIDDRDLELHSKNDIDKAKSRVKLINTLYNSRIIETFIGDNIEFLFKQRVINLFDVGDTAPWRFKAKANCDYLRKCVPNLNIRYRFGMTHVSNDLVKFVKELEEKLEGVHEDEVIELNPRAIKQLRYSYVQSHSNLRSIQCEFIKPGDYIDHDIECFSQAVPYLVDSGILSVDRSGAVLYDPDKARCIDLEKLRIEMTVDGYTPVLHSNLYE